MDADVEMTSLSQYDSDEDAALTAELDMTLPSDYPPYRKTHPRNSRRRCSLCTFLSCIVAVVVFVVAMMHIRHNRVVDGTTTTSTSPTSMSTKNNKNNDEKPSTGMTDFNQQENNRDDNSPQGHGTQNDIVRKPSNSTKHETSPPSEETLLPPEPPSLAPASIHQNEPTMNWRHHNNSSSSSSGGDDQEYNDQTIAEWLQANVTLQDGIKYQVVGQIEHDPTAFTEGLAYANGLLYESTGLNGGSSIRTLDPTTGKIIHSYPLDSKYFGEGLTYVNGKLYQLTYKKKTGFIFDASDLSKKPETFPFQTTTGEGWGMTYDSNKNELIVSDGSSFLHYWDATTTKPLRKIGVIRQNKQNARDINELEWWRGRVLANVWFEDTILVIHPETGMVEKEYDFQYLWPKRTRRATGAGVLNGISVSEDPNVLYITGKNWNRTYLVKLLY